MWQACELHKKSQKANRRSLVLASMTQVVCIIIEYRICIIYHVLMFTYRYYLSSLFTVSCSYHYYPLVCFSFFLSFCCSFLLSLFLSFFLSFLPSFFLPFFLSFFLYLFIYLSKNLAFHFFMFFIFLFVCLFLSFFLSFFVFLILSTICIILIGI